ncbi:MAG: radical SAM family heme chaperone HemW [Bacteroidaceae bacterium]
MAGLYLHIPFCKQRCAYCDFFSTTSCEERDAYVEALCLEMKQRKDYLDGASLQTIYLGGGTPSLLSEANFERLFKTIYALFTVDFDVEITLEANPDDLTPTYLQMLSCFPINRISMGIQTFSNATLKLLNRRHTAEQAIQAVYDCRFAGFQNLSLDLIYGLPGEDLACFQKNVQQVLALEPSHLSAYSLTIEEGTPLYRMCELGEVHEMGEEESLLCYMYLCTTLKEAGFHHYEISNFARSGCESRHNSSYWCGTPYLGLGPSAHSYDGESRQWNVSSLSLYLKGITSGKHLYQREELDKKTRYNDFLLTRLRTSKGVSLDKIQALFGVDSYTFLLTNAEPWISSGKLKLEDKQLYLTQDGIFISDTILSSLFLV